MRITYAGVLSIISQFARCDAEVNHAGLRRLSLFHDPLFHENQTGTSNLAALKKLAQQAGSPLQHLFHDAEQVVEDTVQGVLHKVAPSLEDTFAKHRLTEQISEQDLSDLLLQGTDDDVDTADNSKGSKDHHKKPKLDTHYTVVVNTYNRHDCLRTVLDRWFECSPGEMRVVWSEGALDIPEWLHDLEAADKVVIDRYQTHSLSNRFHPKDFKYDAVFTVDDDITYSCSAVQGMLKMFRQDPGRMVSFAPRYVTKGRGYDFLRKKANTVFITKGGFSHKDLFTDFWLPEYDEVRERVDNENQGEDLLMSFVHAMHYGNDKAIGLLKQHKSSITQYDCPGELDKDATEADKKDLHGTETKGVTKAQRWWSMRQAFLQDLFTKYGDVFHDHVTKPIPEEMAREL